MHSDVDQVHSDVWMLQLDFGGMVERQLRKDVKHQFGERYAKRLLAHSIMDFVHLFQDGAIQPKHNVVDDRNAMLIPATQVCSMFCSSQ